jgi:hypothetical protein
MCITLFTPRQKPTLQEIERLTKNKFEWLRPPQPTAILKTAANTAVDDATAITPEVRCRRRAAAACLTLWTPQVRTFFVDAAKKLLSALSGDSTQALAACLAVATGYSSPPPMRSLLNNLDGFCTMKFDAEKKIMVRALTHARGGALGGTIQTASCDSPTTELVLRLVRDSPDPARRARGRAGEHQGHDHARRRNRRGFRHQSRRHGGGRVADGPCRWVVCVCGA